MSDLENRVAALETRADQHDAEITHVTDLGTTALRGALTAKEAHQS
jgi:hypothetical protein